MCKICHKTPLQLKYPISCCNKFLLIQPNLYLMAKEDDRKIGDHFHYNVLECSLRSLTIIPSAATFDCSSMVTMCNVS